jgi:CheY-like chemotaxis protein
MSVVSIVTGRFLDPTIKVSSILKTDIAKRIYHSNQISVHGAHVGLTGTYEPLLALQNFKPGVYGLLIIDIAMPVIDGFRLYQLIKQIDNKPKVLFATLDLTSSI